MEFSSEADTDIHRELNVDSFANEIKKFARSHENRLLHHMNVKAIQLLDTTAKVRRLKREPSPMS